MSLLVKKINKEVEYHNRSTLCIFVSILCITCKIENRKLRITYSKFALVGKRFQSFVLPFTCEVDVYECQSPVLAAILQRLKRSRPSTSTLF